MSRRIAVLREVERAGGGTMPCLLVGWHHSRRQALWRASAHQLPSLARSWTCSCLAEPARSKVGNRRVTARRSRANVVLTFTAGFAIVLVCGALSGRAPCVCAPEPAAPFLSAPGAVASRGRAAARFCCGGCCQAPPGSSRIRCVCEAPLAVIGQASVRTYKSGVA